MAPKSKKRDQKKLAQNFRFSCFLVWPLNHIGNNPWHVLKQVELQPETPRVQSFGAKSGASATKPHASGGLRAKIFVHKGPALAGPQPSSLKIDSQALMLFRTCLSDLNSLAEFKQPLFSMDPETSNSIPG